MAKIIVDINETGDYSFIVKRDTNRPIATSVFFPKKAQCMDGIALFREFAKDAFYWSFEVSANGNYYATWRKNGVQINTRHYMFHRDLFKVVEQIKTEVSFKTPILHTTIKFTKDATV